jgi:hypothetical protein
METVMNVLKILFCCAAITIAGCDLEEETKGWAPIALVAGDAEDTDKPAADGEQALDCWSDEGAPSCCAGDSCCSYDEGTWHCR